MNMLNAIEIARLLVLRSDGNQSIIVLDMDNAGSNSRWDAAFPGLDAEQKDHLGEMSFLFIDNRHDARCKFQSLIWDLVASRQILITGTMTLVTPADEDDEVDAIAWEACEDTRPVLVGGSWIREPIVR